MVDSEGMQIAANKGVNILPLFTNHPCVSCLLYDEITISHIDLMAMKLDKATLPDAPTIFMKVAIDLDLAIRVYQCCLLVVFVVNHVSIILYRH